MSCKACYDEGHKRGYDTAIREVVAYLRKWDEIRQASPITRRLSSIIDSIERGEHRTGEQA